MKESRLRRQLSQESLAFEISLDRSFISLLERGKRSPTLNTIVVLAAAFEVSPSQLLIRCEEVLQNG